MHKEKISISNVRQEVRCSIVYSLLHLESISSKNLSNFLIK